MNQGQRLAAGLSFLSLRKFTYRSVFWTILPYNWDMKRSYPTAVFFNVPGHGHVNPSLPLVAELTRRGHQITYSITPGYQKQVEATGAVFRATPQITDRYFDGPKLNGSSPQYAAYYLMKTTAEILPELIEETQAIKPDYVLFDGMCPWGYFVAKVLGLPSVASMSLLQMPRPSLKHLANPAMRRLLLAVLMRDPGKFNAALRISRQIGETYKVPYPGLTSLLNVLGDLSISYTSAAFQPDSDKVDPSIWFVGRSHPENPAFPPGFFDRLGDRPLVYISLGSLINDNRAFFRDCMAAFAGREAYVMISTGRRFNRSDFDSIPENVEVLEWVPQAAVLKRASLFVSHGGLNSVHDALYFGVPLLLVPQQDEQALNSARVVELGAGLSIDKRKLSSEGLMAAADTLLREPKFMANAAYLGETLREAGGISRAADLVEQRIGGRQP